MMLSKNSKGANESWPRNINKRKNESALSIKSKFLPTNHALNRETAIRKREWEIEMLEMRLWNHQKKRYTGETMEIFVSDFFEAISETHKSFFENIVAMDWWERNIERERERERDAWIKRDYYYFFFFKQERYGRRSGVWLVTRQWSWRR